MPWGRRWVCQPGSQPTADRQTQLDDPRPCSAPPPRSASDVSPAAPRPRRSARMRVTCGRHLPVPGSQRQSEPARAAAAAAATAITASAKSSARCPRHVSWHPPLATRDVLPGVGRHPEEWAGKHGGPARASRAAGQVAARDCARTPGTRVPDGLAGVMAARGSGLSVHPPPRPAPVFMAASHFWSTPGSIYEVALI